MAGPKTSTSALPVARLEPKKLKESKIGHRRVDQDGQTTFKKIQTNQIMASIQLGIKNAVGSKSEKPNRELLLRDFTEKEIIDSKNFPDTEHNFNHFWFKSYAPVAFRYFRELFGIEPSNYIQSLCKNPLQELTNPGASGSVFYLTDDDKFIIKTVDHREAEFLQELLPGYYRNLNENPRTLLPKYFGLYCYQCGGKNVRLVVMNNLLPTIIKCHQKFDLKGSTYKRKANKQERNKSNPTFKDLDFIELHPGGILLDSETYNTLTQTIKRDCLVLESFRIMDYSLLVGIYNLDSAKRERMEKRATKVESSKENVKFSDEAESSSSEVSQSGTKDPKLVRSKCKPSVRKTMETKPRELDGELVLPGRIPAQNAKGDHLLLYLGIIDILQSFRLMKKIEHAWKSVLHDGATVSVHKPDFYARRFQNFMNNTVFKIIPALKHSSSKRRGKPRPLATSESLSKIPAKSQCTYSQEDSSFRSPSYSHKFTQEESTATVSYSKNIFSCTGKEKSQSNPDLRRMISVHMSKSGVRKYSSVTWEGTDVRLSQVPPETKCTTDCVAAIGLGSTLRTVTWTPPHNVEGCLPTPTKEPPSLPQSNFSGEKDT